MERLLVSLALCSVTAGTLAAQAHTTQPHLDNPLHHVSVSVSRQGAQVRGVGAGQVQFRPEALIVDDRTQTLQGRPAVKSGMRITQYLGHGVGVWYLDTPFGIEQGFVLSRPAQKRTGIRMRLDGDLLPSRHGSGLDFSMLNHSKPMLGYSRLVAYDADHRRLPARLVLDGRQLTLSVDTRGAHYPVTLDPMLSANPEPLSTPDGIAAYQVADSSDGNVAIVGAPIARTQLGDVYVFTRTHAVWSSAAVIPRPFSSGLSQFGYSVGLSADGQTAVIGAPGGPTYGPAVFVYSHGSGGWTLAADLSTVGVGVSGEDSAFGQAVAISADGHTILTGAPQANDRTGGAYVYAGSGATWSAPVALQVPAISSWARAGTDVALSSDGKTAVVSAPTDRTYQGAIYVFTYATSWSTTPITLGNPAVTYDDPQLGEDLAMSGDGSVILARAATTGSLGLDATQVYAYTLSSGVWSAPQAMHSGGAQLFFSHTMALSPDGTEAVIGEPWTAAGDGGVSLYTHSGATWSGPVTMSNIGQGNNAHLGSANALSADGLTAFVGSAGTDPVFVYNSPVGMSFSVSPSATGSVAPDSRLTLTFTVADTDPDQDATDLVLDEVLPAGASYVSSDGGAGACNYISASNSVSCTLSSLVHPSGTWQPSVTFMAPSTGGTVTNVAALSADQTLDDASDLNTAITVRAAGGGSSSGGSSSSGSGGAGSGTTGSGGGTFGLLSLMALLSMAGIRRFRQET